jgi:transcriptional regulator with XRE-family HTH domain
LCKRARGKGYSTAAAKIDLAAYQRFRIIDMADDEAHWATQLLETSLQASGLSERELEKRLGWDKGALGKILHDRGAPDHQQVLDVLEVLSRNGRAPRPESRSGVGGPLVGTLLERFERLGIPASTDPVPGGKSPAGPLPQDDGLERRVEEILAEAFGRLEEIPDDED